MKPLIFLLFIIPSACLASSDVREIYINEGNKEKRKMMLDEWRFQKFFLIKEPVDLRSLTKCDCYEDGCCNCDECC